MREGGRSVMQITVELGQGATINGAVEIDHGFERDPVFMPAPGVELGMIACAERNVVIPTRESQQIPDLLLAAVTAAPFALDPVLRDFVAQPVAGASENPHMVRFQSYFFLQFPI